MRPLVASRPAWLIRLSGQAPRAAFIAALAILSFAGLVNVLRGSPEFAPLRAAEPMRDLTAESFAEAFTRTYLTWDATRPERHERDVAAFTSESLEPGAGLTPPASGAQEVTWTATVHDEQVPGNRRLVTVAARTRAGRDFHLSVPIRRDRRGLLAVSGYPALVGAPPADRASPRADEPDVEDTQLRAVVGRAIRNYLRLEGTNLRADLDPRAVVALPATPLEVKSIDSISRIAPGRVALEVRAEGGAAWTLRYELEVVKRERWYVRSIQTNPTERNRQ